MRIIAALLLAGCVSQQSPPVFSDEDDPRAMAGVREAPPPPEPAAPRARTGTIDRDALEVVLDGGPGRFLPGVRVHASLTTPEDGGGRRVFHGWVVDEVRDPRLASVDLLPGDLILMVNGNALMRPDDLQVVWDGLREASQLVIEVARPQPDAGEVERFQLTYIVVDSEPQPAPN